MNKKRQQRLQTLVDHDAPYYAQGFRLAGIDEAGRGPLAGPVVAACVVMPKEPVIPWVDDSKMLSELRRELVYNDIIDTALYIGIGWVDAGEIDRINILQATIHAMRQAAAGARADIYLVDAVKNLQLDGREKALVRGDSLSYAIAAASIIAKVSRDRLMRQEDERYPHYCFLKNKGYGTAEHIKALREYGPCPLHRKSFIGNFSQADV
ncbi:MAG: ribonuclease HII [Clostridiales bacterium]|nr:ribonuclease HII [Clostridiales bacterium]